MDSKSTSSDSATFVPRALLFAALPAALLAAAVAGAFAEKSVAQISRVGRCITSLS